MSVYSNMPYYQLFEQNHRSDEPEDERVGEVLDEHSYAQPSENQKAT